MTDLTYCYLHMTEKELASLDTIETSEYIDNSLEDEQVDVPAHLVPPNPDDTEVLPAQVHPSYPYGDPKNIKHPAARPRIPHDRGSRALFEDASLFPGSSLRWGDLALDTLLPVDEEREETARAAQARKMASGTASSQHAAQMMQAPPPQGQAPPPQQAPGTGDEDEEEEEEEDVEESFEDDEE